MRSEHETELSSRDTSVNVCVLQGEMGDSGCLSLHASPAALPPPWGGGTAVEDGWLMPREPAFIPCTLCSSTGTRRNLFVYAC